ncbi:MAG: OmpA family protein [Chlorobia bacterium]|nr:OmpA family protein [Fimbriimonadaceae bacterium]
MRLKTSGKLIILILVIGGAFGAYKMWGSNLTALLPGSQERNSTVPVKIDLPDGPGINSDGDGGDVTMPTAELANISGPQIRWLHWAWNAQMGLMFANGGKETTAGSLMAKKNVSIKFTRQDDVSKMQESLIAFASQLKNGTSQPTNGAHFVTIMGDGSPAFLTAVNAQLRKLGPEYRAKVIACIGYSRGEDKFMGPESWKTNPSASKGGVVSGYIGDGDWNIAMKWLGDNGLKNNPDEKTWDPDALNWINTSDYIDAAQKYITGYTETRPVVKNGKRTGQTKTIKVNGVVTWTPGDVQVASEKGGLVSIVSTKEYNYQMPCTIIGIDKWMRSNRQTVENMLAAIFEGGRAIKGSQSAFLKGAAINAEVFGEKDADADYWARYFTVQREKDKQGLTVELGGSSVNDLTDGLVTFGLVRGAANLFGATYNGFGDVLKQQYPDRFPTYDSLDSILDTSYMKNLSARSSGASSTVAVKDRIETPTTRPAGGGKKISTLQMNIPFNTGSAQFAPLAGAQLQKLQRQLLIASNTIVEVHGHTDNVGSPDKNMQLSEDRAFAVKKWLENKFPLNFPKGRISVFAKGQSNPLASNATAQGKATNRRVEIILRSGG